VGVSLAAISSIFSSHRFGYLVGSLFGGKLFDRLDGNRFLAVLALLMAAGAVLIPIARVIWLLLALCFVTGCMGGAIDVGGNILLVWMAPKRLGSLMSILHLFFGVGAFLSPLFISQAILLAGDINWGYWALSLLIFPVGIAFLWLPSPRPKAENDRPRETFRAYLLPIVIAIFLALYVGAEVGFGGWIYTYTLKKGLANQVHAGYLTSAFWAAYTGGRLVSALLALRLDPRSILGGSLAGSLVSLLIISLFQTSLIAVWCGAIGFGLFMGPIFPAAITFASRIMRLTGAITGLFLVGASMGSISLPWIIGQLFERMGPVVVVASIAAYVLVATLLFIGLAAKTSRRKMG
jgi:FHS family Na+ dependent glucose MFS transporter 1